MFCGTKLMEYGWITIWRTRGLGICSTLRILLHFTPKVIIVVNVNIMARLLWDISNRRISTTSLVSFCNSNNSFFFFFFKLQISNSYFIYVKNNKFLLLSHIQNMLLKLLLKSGWSKVISIRVKSNGIGMIRDKFYIFLYLWLREKGTFLSFIEYNKYSILIHIYFFNQFFYLLFRTKIILFLDNIINIIEY